METRMAAGISDGAPMRSTASSKIYLSDVIYHRAVVKSCTFGSFHALPTQAAPVADQLRGYMSTAGDCRVAGSSSIALL